MAAPWSHWGAKLVQVGPPVELAAMGLRIYVYQAIACNSDAGLAYPAPLKMRRHHESAARPWLAGNNPPTPNRMATVWPGFHRVVSRPVQWPHYHNPKACRSSAVAPGHARTFKPDSLIAWTLDTCQRSTPAFSSATPALHAVLYIPSCCETCSRVLAGISTSCFDTTVHMRCMRSWCRPCTPELHTWRQSTPSPGRWMRGSGSSSAA